MAKPFPLDVVEAAWNRSGGACECTLANHRHFYGRCRNPLIKGNRGREAGSGAWEAHHINPDAPPVLGNCRILCWPCHKATL